MLFHSTPLHSTLIYSLQFYSILSVAGQRSLHQRRQLSLMQFAATHKDLLGTDDAATSEELVSVSERVSDEPL